jgi:transcription elongation factor Elf1
MKAAQRRALRRQLVRLHCPSCNKLWLAVNQFEPEFIALCQFCGWSGDPRSKGQK